VIAKLEEMGLLVKTEDYEHAVGHCYRCKTIIEPHLSWQWFVRVKPLAEEAIRVVEEGKIKFIPANWAKTYFEWMYNIHDWCISRQLWWGHRIPAWYCQECEHIVVSDEPPTKCEKCPSSELVQDEDVLDTWFSSALWPFVTMGWPEKTEDLKTFYPTDLMSTGWVARMIMMGLKFTKDIPFRHVFINGLVRDFKRRKMSKSEGNAIDPLEMIEKYGTDALRFTLAALAIPGMDLSLAEERMAGYQAFANKIWNASRFVLMNIQGEEFCLKEEELTLADRWIRSRLVGIVEELDDALENYKFYEAANKIYHFIWGEFCDWYIELVKPSLKQGNRTSEAVLVDTLDQILRLLHPFMPFITEEIWQHIPSSDKSLVMASFPRAKKGLRDEGAEREMRFLQEAIVGIRTIRAENRIPPKKKVDLLVRVKDERKVGKKAEAEIIRHTMEYIQTLANIRQVEILEHFPKEKKLLKGIAGSWEIAIPIEEGVFNLEQEKQRLEKELSKIELDIEKIETRFNNTNFLNRAPKEVIKEAKGKLRDLQGKKTKLEESLKHILSLI
jgi:valyl-tRNA synthetase